MDQHLAHLELSVEKEGTTSFEPIDQGEEHKLNGRYELRLLKQHCFVQG